MTTMSGNLTVLPPLQPKPIAPKLKPLKNSNTDTVSSSTNRGNATKRKQTLQAFHPTLGYAIPPPLPQKVARRNARERNRVKQVNGGFEVLRSHIPSAAKHKKMSKVDTLRHAVEYIQSLQRMLTTDGQEIKQEDFCFRMLPSPSSASSCSSSSSPSPSPPTATSKAPPPPLTLMQPPTAASLYNPPEQVYPLTPRTPNTPTYHQMQQQQQQHPHFPAGNESGYETSGYFSQSSSSLMSPVGGARQQHYQQQLRAGSASPASPSVYSEGSVGSYHHNNHHQQPSHNNPLPLQQQQQQQQPGFDHNIPMSYYDNSEEDDLLDTIVNWQDQH